MGVTFNADEAFAMACEIERNGQKFYRSGAEMTPEGSTRKLLLELADWEKTHEDRFASMRSELTEEEKRSTAFDPDGEAELYLQAMADAHVFNVHKDPTELLKGKEKAEEVIDVALGFERDSILFFIGLEKMTPKRLGAEKVREIVKEEISHVSYLKRELAKLGEA
jgi:rubrerythrin